MEKIDEPLLLGESCFVQVASVFTLEGPAETLLNKFRRGSAYLAASMASFMVLQFLAFKWPKPDFIVPVPMPLLRKFCRGYNPAALMAKELARLLEVAYCPALKRRYTPPRHSLDSFPDQTFFCKKAVTDKYVLLVDDFIGTGSTLNACGLALAENGPQSIFGLTFASRTMDLYYAQN